MSAHGSGEVKYPDYLETMHKELTGYDWDSLDVPMPTLVNAAVLANPYEDADAFDPNAAYAFTASSPLSNMNAVVTAMAGLSAGLSRALSETTDFNTILTNAETKVGTTFSAVDNDVDNMEDESLSYSGSALTALRLAARTEVGVQAAAAEAHANARLSGVMSEAVAAAQDAIDDNVQDMVDAFEEDAKPAYMRSVNRFTGMMADIGAAQSSAFVMGMATLEASFMRDVNRFSAEKRSALVSQAVEQYLMLYKGFIDQYFADANEQTKMQLAAYQNSYQNFLTAYLENSKEKNMFRLQAVREMTGILQMLVQTKQASVGNYIDFYTKLIIAMKEKADKQVEFDGLESRWPMEITMYQANVLASLAGMGYMVDKPVSAGQSALSGAAAGAMIGKYAGGPPGAAIGALLGGLGGYFE